ncbi:MAG TPA: enoyl-CoA hydratase/isomerase family protein [Solirubrobacteraceae bacterium]|jgi:enoyl-CoA hydratase/carnithine racemase|nr:enoyl-CoA hydratase/isomerase family protein [Solirubrobacteraceae bacterium]
MTAASAGPVLWRREGQIGHITLNRPKAFNSITIELLEQLGVALGELAADSDAIIIRGAEGNFSTGGDLKFIRESQSDPKIMRVLAETGGRVFDLIGVLPIPVVAAVEGFCLAGGFELLQACDFAVAAEDAVIGDGHVEFAQIPGGGGAVRLVRYLGHQAALGILLTGDRFTGAQAAARGLVHRAFPAGRFEEGVADLAAQLARRGRGALEAIKQTVIELEQLPLDQALAGERDAFIAHVTGPVAAAGLERFLARQANKGT